MTVLGSEIRVHPGHGLPELQSRTSTIRKSAANGWKAWAYRPVTALVLMEIWEYMYLISTLHRMCVKTPTPANATAAYLHSPCALISCHCYPF